MSGKSVVGSIIASVIIMSALTYFALPFLFPVLRAENLAYQEDLVSEEGILLQSKYGEWNSEAVLYDSNISSYEKIPDTELQITIQENSSLNMVFSGMGLIYLDSSFSGAIVYKIALVVDGVDNRTLIVNYYDGNPTSGYHWLTYNLYMNFMTNPLPAGTYNISMFWISGQNPSGDNSLILTNSNNNFTRTLLVQEIKTL